MPSIARLASLVALLGATHGSTTLAASTADEAAKLTVISSGASAKIGYYAPIRATLSSEKPATVTKVPEGLEAKVENNILTISGLDKQKVGQFAAVVKKLKPVEPYKGKGFRYVGEQVRRKEGKKAAA